MSIIDDTTPAPITTKALSHHSKHKMFSKYPPTLLSTMDNDIDDDDDDEDNDDNILYQLGPKAEELSSATPSPEMSPAKIDEEEKQPSTSRTTVAKQLFKRKSNTGTTERKSSAHNNNNNDRTSLSSADQTTPSSSKKETKRKSKVSLESPLKVKQSRKSTVTPQQQQQQQQQQVRSSGNQQQHTPKTKKKKSKQTTVEAGKSGDPMSIFDFFDDDEDGEIVELRSTAAPTIASSSQSTVIKDEPLPIEKNKNVQQSQNRGRPSRKSTVNEVPLNTLCCECQKLGTAENATDCDKCKNFYHYQCCLPPLAGYPKTRGYGWTCHRCNISNDDEDETISPAISPVKSGKRERKSRYGNSSDYVVETN